MLRQHDLDIVTPCAIGNDIVWIRIISWLPYAPVRPRTPVCRSASLRVLTEQGIAALFQDHSHPEYG